MPQREPADALPVQGVRHPGAARTPRHRPFTTEWTRRPTWGPAPSTCEFDGQVCGSRGTAIQARMAARARGRQGGPWALGLEVHPAHRPREGASAGAWAARAPGRPVPARRATCMAVAHSCPLADADPTNPGAPCRCCPRGDAGSPGRRLGCPLRGQLGGKAAGDPSPPGGGGRGAGCGVRDSTHGATDGPRCGPEGPSKMPKCPTSNRFHGPIGSAATRGRAGTLVA